MASRSSARVARPEKLPGRWQLPPGWRPSSIDSAPVRTPLWPRPCWATSSSSRVGRRDGRWSIAILRFGRSHPKAISSPSPGSRWRNPTAPPRQWSRQQSIEVDRAERELARVVSRFTTLRRQFDQSRQSERAALETLESIEAKLAGATEALGRSTRTGADLEAELGRLDERRLALTTAITDRQGQISRLTATIEALEGEEAQRQRLLDEWSGRRRKVADEREGARASWQQAASQASAAAERRALIEARCQVVTDEIGVDHRRPVSPGSLARLAPIEDLARKAIEVIRVHVDAIRDRQDQNRRQARSIGEALGRVRQDHENRQSEIESHRSRLSSLAVEQAEARVRREAVVEALRREIDASEEVALAALRPETEEGANRPRASGDPPGRASTNGTGQSPCGRGVPRSSPSATSS